MHHGRGDLVISQGEIVLRLVIAAVLGGLIGLERERSYRPAGFRTHMLVCIGAALIMLVSMYGFDFPSTRDPGRIAAQVVSGIGFLGAGTIIREGVTIRGLTTAASLWVVSGIGLAAGAGFHFAALITTVLVFFTLVFFGYVEKHLLTAKHFEKIDLIILDRPGQLGRVGMIFGRHNINIKDVSMRHEHEELHLSLSVLVPPNLDFAAVLAELADQDGVKAVERTC